MKSNCIKKLRITLLWQQHKFAKELGVSRSAVCQWESGERVPNLYNIKNIVEIAKNNGIKFNYDELIKD
jgi:DNA-binding XRE family transcriptional regulator